MNKSNFLLKIMVGMVVGLLMVILLSKCTSSSPHVSASHLPTPVNDNASGDTVTETIKTLTAEIHQDEKNSEKIAKENEALKKQNERYQTLLETVNQAPKSPASLTNESSATETTFTSKTIIGEDKSHEDEIPIIASNQITSVTDLSFTASLQDTASVGKEAVSTRQGGAAALEEKNKPVPYYTIPPNATTIDTLLMTSLIGRVPVNGKVDDPYPFTVMVGQKNLMANGLELPEITGMVAAGYAIGEMNNVGAEGKKCVRGYITSVTFVFQDGTISTTSSNENSKPSDSDANNALGWLSDEMGNPCIGGTFYTNAPSYLALDMGLNAASGAAQAYANSETTTLNSGDSFTSGVTGNQGKYVLGQALSSSVSDTNDWIKNRLSQSFDAVVVLPTTEQGQARHIAIHFQQEIDIDYNKEGRKIRYDYLQSFKNQSLD